MHAAAAIADYLHGLGISHVYSSPYLQAAPGSKHGYDVVDHHKVNDELGGYQMRTPGISTPLHGKDVDAAHDHYSPITLTSTRLGRLPSNSP